MEKLNVTLFIKNAREKLKGRDAHQMAAIHTGVTVAVSLVIMVLQYVLAQGIGNTGGLSGMETRSMLETGQMVLQWANNLLLPFWNLGFMYVALRWAQEKRADRADLLTGFRRIGPYLGLMLNRVMLSFIVIFLCINFWKWKSINQDYNLLTCPQASTTPKSFLEKQRLVTLKKLLPILKTTIKTKLKNINSIV